MIYLGIFILMMLLLSHKVLHEDFREIRESYKAMVADKAIYVEEGGHYLFEKTGMIYLAKSETYMLQNGVIFFSWFAVWIHPYTLYWLIKYRLYIKKLNKQNNVV